MKKREAPPVDDNDLEVIRTSVREWWSHNTCASLVEEKGWHQDEVDTLQEATLWIMEEDDMSLWEVSVEEMRDIWRWEPFLKE